MSDLVLRPKYDWRVIVDKSTCYLFMRGIPTWTGSFQDVEDYMFNSGILTREEFKQQVWTDGFLSGKNDIREVL